MSANPAYELSPDQKRFLVLTKELGLDYDEALFAIGRRSGGMPSYRKLSRQSQFNKVQELVSFGLTQVEAERVVGVSSKVNATARLRPGTPARKSNTPSVSTGAGAQPRCSGCKQAKQAMVSFGKGGWLCAECRRMLRKARKLDKRRCELAKYYNALTHPEFSGLEGVRK